MSGTFVVFDLLIPRTDDRTAVVHSPSLFDDWTIETAERFGGVTRLGADSGARASGGASTGAALVARGR